MLVFLFLEIKHDFKFHVEELRAKRDEQKPANLDPIGKEHGQELLADLNPCGIGINLKKILIKRENFVGFLFSRNRK